MSYFRIARSLLSWYNRVDQNPTGKQVQYNTMRNRNQVVIPLNLGTEAYIRQWECLSNRKYRFLIMAGEGELRNGLPLRLRTRLKNKLHRSVYVKLEYYKDGKGIVKEWYNIFNSIVSVYLKEDRCGTCLHDGFWRIRTLGRR